MLAALLALNTEAWFPFTPADDVGPSAIGMEAWADAPAGRRGGVRERGDRYVFADGTPVKFWGVNNANLNCAPPKELAERRARRFAKFGINAVRLHKFTYGNGGGIGDPNRSTRLTPEGWDRFDYLTDQLRRRGVYHAWSPIFGHQLRPEDRARVLAYDEVVNAHSGFLKGSDYGLVNLFPDLQALHVELLVHMLRHRNPYSGRLYADDPSLASVELQNEDDVFWPTTHEALLKCPTYKRQAERDFSAWLRKRYGDDAGLRRAWGEDALNAWPEFQADESLARESVFPICHFWWYSREGIANQTASKLGGNPRRLYDMAEYLQGRQNEFYARFARALRETGYQGPIVASCWQAGDGLSHLYNLRSDSLIGTVDRHNYFGGQDSPMRPGPLDARSQLEQVGSGILSTGMQAVAGRPFAISEWVTVAPNEWGAESPALVALYGMGLQGWDASYSFANDEDQFAPTVAIRDGWGVWNVDLPVHLGLYPALARTVRRGDVRPGPVVRRTVVPPGSLERGEVPAVAAEQQGDRKAFGDASLLALGRVETRFGLGSPVDTPPPAGTVKSRTGELAWTADGERGHVTVRTAGTVGLVGFAPGVTHDLGAATAQTDAPFAALFLTAKSPRGTLARDPSLLLTVVARVRNTGQRFSEDGKRLEAVGGPPLRLEPVRATVRLQRRDLTLAHILDHDGRRTGRTLPITGGTLEVDTGRDRTVWYEIAAR